MVEKVVFSLLEHLSWQCLTLAALGWGQVQLKSSKAIRFDENVTRKDWMLNMCQELTRFYANEHDKIDDRVKYFTEIKQFWTKK